MPTIERLVLKNFRKFGRFEMEFDPKRNVIVGYNEAGKSSILLAIDLALGASRSRVDTIGLEALFNQEAVGAFLSGERTYDMLPELLVEVYLSYSGRPEFNGKNNTRKVECDGVRLVCKPDDALSKEIVETISEDQPIFPFEYYTVQFSAFSGDPYTPFRRPLRHLYLDSSRIDSEYATREYTRSLFMANTDHKVRSKLENTYRREKARFRDQHLLSINKEISGYEFAVRTDTRSNLEADLVITESGIPIESRGKGRQCFVKTDFALQRRGGDRGLDLLLIEEPENHLSHVSMRQLVERIAEPNDKQLLIATHSSFMCSRLDLRKVQMLGTGDRGVSLRDLQDATARFFMKAPDNNVLEFALSRKAILVEGDAEFILTEQFYKSCSGVMPEDDGVHVISVGGTSFKRYLDVAKLLGTKTAVIRDNDGDYDKNCVVNYADYNVAHIGVFADSRAIRPTFEVCLYEDNRQLCEKLFGDGRRTLNAQAYMLANKTDAAFELLEKAGGQVVVPEYIQNAIQWIRS